MKISNETKVGALTAIAITLLILGFNFLKGKPIFEKNFKIYAVFKSVQGLSVSNAVMINGLQVGKVYEMHETDKDLSGILVTLNLNKSINIPANSMAHISGSLLGNTTMDIEMGNADSFLKNGDTISTDVKMDLLDQVKGSLDPAMIRINASLQTLDSVLKLVGNLFDKQAHDNFQSLLSNLAVTTANLNILLNPQTGALAQTLSNTSAFTDNLKKNNDTITQIFSNLKNTTEKLSELELQQTLTNLDGAVAALNVTLDKLNNSEGSLGLLINDKKLYNNLNSTANSLNILLQDIRIHPRRYTGGLVFGKKDKSAPLMTPLPDSLTELPATDKKRR
ncbi:MAG: MlaD family protein [Chitinophagaceae bacterium]|nr:MlaD family protein [Chitinophagaceae bacterium]